MLSRLWFFNTRFGRYLIGASEKYPIIAVTPSSIHYLVGKNKFRAVFGRIGSVGKLLHMWDRLANIFFPKLNLGFDTFNSNSAGDGTVANTGTVYATVRNAADGQNAYPTTAVPDVAQHAYVNPTYYITRGFFPFDTSSLPDNATITDATFSLYFTNNTGADSDSVAVVQSTQASTADLTTADYDQLGATSGGSILVSSITTNQYNDITLNATGLTWISLIGYTKLGTRTLNDINNSAPTGNTTTSANSADSVSNKPKLVVNYTLPGGASLSSYKSLTGVGM